MNPSGVKIKGFIRSHKKVAENYFFMTILQFLNPLIYIFIYPYLIKTLGVEGYGQYIFALSLATYFTTLITFGFDFPGVKAISLHPDNKKRNSIVFSSITSAKIYIFLISILIYGVLLFFIPFLRKNWIIYAICFFSSVVPILLPTWYFQGVQKMRLVTSIQIISRLVSIVLILLLIHSPKDDWKFALIMTSTSVAGAAFGIFLLIRIENIHIHFVSLRRTIPYFKDALPFFWSSSASVVKQQFTTLILGTCFSMTDVSIYDLAMKIISLPMTALASLNNALFPKIIKGCSSSYLKKVIFFQGLLSLTVVLLIILFGKFAVTVLSNNSLSLSMAYPMAIILSIIIPCWLVVGSYINFIYVPRGMYYYVTRTQVYAFLIYLVVCLVGVFAIKNIYIVGISLAISGLFELVYNSIVVKREKLLS